MHVVPDRPASNRTDGRESNHTPDVDSPKCEYNIGAISNNEPVFPNYNSASS